MTKSCSVGVPKIVILLSSLGRGGAQRQAVVTGIGLERHGYDVQFVCLRGEASLDAEVLSGGGSVRHLGHNGRFGGLRGRVRLLFDDTFATADVVYSYMPEANVAASLVSLARRRPAIVWGIRESGLQLSHYGPGTRLIARLARVLSKHPQLIVCNSAAAVRHYGELGYPAEKMVVVPNGIDTTRFAPDERDRRAARSEMAFRDGDFVVLCLARVDPMKGQLDLLEAVGRIAEDCRQVRVLLVGDHDDAFAARVETDARRLGVDGIVTLLPGTPRPERMLRACDLLVMSSRFGEGFPNVLGEAMACGTQVVATDVGDSRAVVSGLGAVVPPGDIESLATAIRSAVTGLDSGEARNRRRAHIVENFSIDCLVANTDRSIRSVLAERPDR